jgi:hypothetical protein
MTGGRGRAGKRREKREEREEGEVWVRFIWDGKLRVLLGYR